MMVERSALPISHRSARALALAATLLASGCGVNSEQARICQRIIAALEDDPDKITILRIASHPKVENGVILDYALREDEGRTAEANTDAPGQDDESKAHWISCRFVSEGFGLGFDKQIIAEVVSDRVGRLSGVDLEMLRIWLRLSKREPSARESS